MISIGKSLKAVMDVLFSVEEEEEMLSDRENDRYCVK